METVSTPTRKCYDCEQTYPLTAEFFGPRTNHAPPFETMCRRCIKLRAAEARERKKKVPNILAKIEQCGIDLLNHEALRGGNNIPHTAELLEEIMNSFGGVQSFARLYAAHYYQCEPGKAQRTKVLAAVIAMTMKNVDQGGAKKPLDLYSEEELHAEFEKRVTEEAQKSLLRIAHVPNAG